MKIHHLTTTQALTSLHSVTRGLSVAEAQRRFAEFGPNRIEEMPGTPLWRRLLAELTHLFALILWLAATLAFVAEWQDPGQGMAALGWAIVGVIVLNGGFSFWRNARRARDRGRDLLPRACPCCGTAKQEVGVEMLVPGTSRYRRGR